MRNRLRLTALALMSLLFLISSCTPSLNVLKRKYRPGYSINFSKKNDRPADPKAGSDSLVSETEVPDIEPEDLLIAGIENSIPVIADYSSPEKTIACDTPPKSKMDDPNFSLYKKKEPDAQPHSNRKKIEPYNLAAIFIFIGALLITTAFPTIGAWFAILIFLTMLILCIASLVRIKKNPHTYSIFSSIFDWIFIVGTIILFVVLLAAGILILASVA